MQSSSAWVSNPDLPSSPTNNCCFSLNPGTEINWLQNLNVVNMFPKTYAFYKRVWNPKYIGRILEGCIDRWKGKKKKQTATTKNNTLGLRSGGNVGFGTNKWVQLMHVGVCYFGFCLDSCFDTRLFLWSCSSQQTVGKWSLFSLFHQNNTFLTIGHTWLSPVCMLVHGIRHFEDERLKHNYCNCKCTD